jgi:D-3-phosphoglycerate dehydrogenase
MTGGPAAGELLVVFSERLGRLGEHEKRIEAETGARLEVRPLWSEEQLLEHCRDADVVVLGATEPMTSRVLGELPRTRSIVRRGVGVDNVDLRAAAAHGIPVGFVPDGSVEEVSDHALACALMVTRRLHLADAAVRRGDPAAAGAEVNRAGRFADSALGVVGFGRIGRALARKASGIFGAVLAADPVVEDRAVRDLGAVPVSLDELWRSADVISLHAPSTPQTHHLVDAATLQVMRPGVALVNTARGDLVDEAALVAAIESGHVAAAALDVTQREPLPPDSPLLRCDAVILTGHTAAKGQRSAETLRRAVVDAVLAALSGRAPAHVANPVVLGQANCRLHAS